MLFEVPGRLNRTSVYISFRNRNTELYDLLHPVSRMQVCQKMEGIPCCLQLDSN